MTDKEKNKVLVLTSTFPRWKNDREPPFVFELCKKLTNTFKCTVLAPDFPDCKTKEEMVGVKVYRFQYFPRRWQALAYEGGIMSRLKEKPLRYLQVPFFLLGEFIATVRQLRNKEYDAVHAHWLIPQGLIAVLARKITRKRIPILCTLHGGDLYSLRNPLFESLKKYVLQRVDGITVVSTSMKKYVEKYDIQPDRIQVIPMGVDLKNTFKPLPSIDRKPDSILFVGRLVEKKGVYYLIKSMQDIVKTRPKVHLEIAGEGPDRAELYVLVNQLNLADNISFLGKIENQKLPELYNRNCIYVFPSVIAKNGDQEGFGLVLVEALGCGCAIISTDLAAMQDIVTHEQNGLVIPQKSSEAITSAVLELLQNHEKREKLAKNGQRDVLRKFDWDEIGERYGSILNSLIEPDESHGIN